MVLSWDLRWVEFVEHRRVLGRNGLAQSLVLLFHRAVWELTEAMGYVWTAFASVWMLFSLEMVVELLMVGWNQENVDQARDVQAIWKCEMGEYACDFCDMSLSQFEQRRNGVFDTLMLLSLFFFSNLHLGRHQHMMGFGIVHQQDAYPFLVCR